MYMNLLKKLSLCLITAAILSSAPASALTWKEVKEFAHKHRTKILIGTGVVVAAVAVVAGVLVWKHYKGGVVTNLYPEYDSLTVSALSDQQRYVGGDMISLRDAIARGEGDPTRLKGQLNDANDRFGVLGKLIQQRKSHSANSLMPVGTRVSL
jgi:hypothetical protein